MADIYHVAKVIADITNGIEESVVECMDENKALAENLVREQLMCGQDGNGEYLSPSYDNDPYFDKEGPWKGRAKAYKEWKMKITPPSSGILTKINARPSDIPNLFIDGTFHSSIKARKSNEGLDIYTSGFRDGPSIERKYGDNIFNLTDESKTYFIDKKLFPFLEEFFKKCGYEL